MTEYTNNSLTEGVIKSPHYANTASLAYHVLLEGVRSLWVKLADFSQF